MVEDASFNAFLKGKLEEDFVVPAVRLPVRAPRRRFFSVFAAAAAVLVVCGMAGWQGLALRRAHAEERAFAVLELFEDGEGQVAFSESAGKSFAERLLAWQDAPFAEVAGL